MSEREFLKVFANRLKYFLELNNMTQKELASRLGVGSTSVYNWLNEIKTPRMDKEDTMCQIFGCKRSDLLEMPSWKHQLFADDGLNRDDYTEDEWQQIKQFADYLISLRKEG